MKKISSFMFCILLFIGCKKDNLDTITLSVKSASTSYHIFIKDAYNNINTTTNVNQDYYVKVPSGDRFSISYSFSQDSGTIDVIFNSKTYVTLGPTGGLYSITAP